uniref:Uncharacterized protein n=1 Tax=Araucaria cunninghamii TaxID=56994 RepID=A0A0D6QWM7_ARACU
MEGVAAYSEPAAFSLPSKPGMELKSDPQVVYDSSTVTRKSHSRASASEWRNFMSSNPSDIFKETQSHRLPKQVHADEEKDIFNKIFKEVEELGVAQMPWKERKAVEKEKVLALGGKPSKNYRLPISEGKLIKKKRERVEQEKIKNEEIFLGQAAKHTKKGDKIRRPEDRGLMASEGIFKHGILHVKPQRNRDEKNDEGLCRMGKRKNKSKKKKHKAKKKH